jgi:predicted chitinase
MRADEFLSESLDEAWRDRLARTMAAGALGTGLAVGFPGADVSAPGPKPGIEEPVQAERPPTPPRTIVRALSSNPLETLLLQTAQAEGLSGLELAQFMAQCRHESINFHRLKERTEGQHYRDYEPEFRKDRKTGKLIPDPETGKPRNFNPKAVTLGNTEVGDGLRFLGRGFMQITGRYNYRKAGEALGLPLESKPQLLEDPHNAAAAAVWFWKHRVRPNVRDMSDTRAVTRQINPGMHGLERREQSFDQYRDRILHVAGSN